MNIDKLKAYAVGVRGRQALKDALALCADVKLRTVREKSVSEQNAQYAPWGRGLFFCLHNKMYFHKCTQCKRSEAEGNANREVFLQKQGIVV